MMSFNGFLLFFRQRTKKKPNQGLIERTEIAVLEKEAALKALHYSVMALEIL